jgi:hypothetical protein
LNAFVGSAGGIHESVTSPVELTETHLKSGQPRTVFPVLVEMIFLLSLPEAITEKKCNKNKIKKINFTGFIAKLCLCAGNVNAKLRKILF